MRRLVSVVVFVCLLFGCGHDSTYLNNVISLRNRVNNSQDCSFVSDVTLDYGDTFYSFCVGCHIDAENNMSFVINEPASIAGICGQISGGTGKLSFDEHLLAFEMLADGNITPIAAPWFFICALKSGYINACGSYDSGYLVRIDDSFNGTDYSLEIVFTEDNAPSIVDILWNGKRIVSMKIRDFLTL